MSRKLLIADNNTFYQQVLGDFFREEGYEVAVASDGVEALERIAAGGVDVIILDLIMPRIDGARLCSFLKSHPAYSSIPVVILSGILADEIEGIETIRADAYVAKMPMELLQATLRKVLSDLEAKPSSPVLAGFEGMFRREVVVEFLEEKRVRETILDSLAEGIADLSEEGLILKTNAAFEEMSGRSAEDLLSRPLAQVFPESEEPLAALFRDARGGGPGPFAAMLRSGERALRFRLHGLKEQPEAEAKIRRLKMRAAHENEKVRLRLAQQLPGFVLLVQDVTEEVRAQEEREKFRERIARSERMSAFGMFVAGAAHELNNPLTGVLGYAQLLTDRVKDPEVRASLSKIESGANRCKAVVDNLMVFSRRGERERRAEPVEAILDEVLQECEPRAQSCGVLLRREIVEPLPRVSVRRSEVVQALVAIVENGILAAATGHRPKDVRICAMADCGSVNFEVTDSGAGIPESVLPRVFDPFFTTRDVGDGRGLGLSVAFGVARSHGGTISADNRPGGGARISFRVPCAAAGEEPGAPAPASARRSGGRILIVDDEPVVVELLADYLGDEFEVETASNGREGLERSQRKSFDLIFLDIRMPDMSGREMFETLRAVRPVLADRVVFTTGDVVQEETRKFLDSVSQPCLPKPFSLEAVSEMIERILGASRPL